MFTRTAAARPAGQRPSSLLSPPPTSRTGGATRLQRRISASLPVIPTAVTHAGLTTVLHVVQAAGNVHPHRGMNVICQRCANLNG
jgi:hypothetical protein